MSDTPRPRRGARRHIDRRFIGGTAWQEAYEDFDLRCSTPRRGRVVVRRACGGQRSSCPRPSASALGATRCFAERRGRVTLARLTGNGVWLEDPHMTLVVHGVRPSSVFGLAGLSENSATYAVGWAFAHCSEYRTAFLRRVFGRSVPPDDHLISLQEFGADRGYTDIELRGPTFHLIVEAKKGWTVPDTEQLRRYVPRFRTTGAHLSAVLSVSSATADYASRHLPASVDGVPVKHLSWLELMRLARDAETRVTRIRERLWLDQVCAHLQEYCSVSRVTDNTAYVVSLSSGPTRAEGPYTFIDVVEQDRSYFHPVGNTWPVEPPNYMAFRYHGRVQSVHHVAGYQVVRDVSMVNPKWCTTDSDHFVYTLGPPMRPARELRTGARIVRAARVWCAVDTLLAGEFDTLDAARDETQRRQKETAPRG